MSGCSDETVCPNCGRQANLYSDSKPFDYSTIDCRYCGLWTEVIVRYKTLWELNEYRVDIGMKPLKRLPKQDSNIL